MVGRPRNATSARQPDGCQAISAGGQDLPIKQVRLEYQGNGCHA
jgi:hypothetical protein